MATINANNNNNTTTSTSNASNSPLSRVLQLFCNYLELTYSSILHLYEIYPATIFQRRNIQFPAPSNTHNNTSSLNHHHILYDFHTIRHPTLSNYIEQIIQHLIQAIQSPPQHIYKFILAIYYPNTQNNNDASVSRLITRFVFDFSIGSTSTSSTSTSIAEANSAQCLSCSFINGLSRLSLINNGINLKYTRSNKEEEELSNKGPPTFASLLYSNHNINKSSNNNINKTSNKSNVNNNSDAGAETDPNMHWSLMSAITPPVDLQFEGSLGEIRIFPIMSYRSELFNLEAYQEYKK
jgi:hypothetical protein